MRYICALTTTLALFSCGNGSSQKSSGDAPAKKPATTTGQAPIQGKEPVKEPVTTTGPEFLQIAATSIPVLEGTKSTSLASKAKATGKSYTVFQFSGVTCESCKEDSPAVQAELAKMSNVARVVVFPNQASEYTEAEYKGFVDKYAQGADRVVDNNLAVLKAIRKDKTQFFGLYIVVRASDGKAFVINSDDAHLKIAAAVKSLSAN